MNVEERLGNEKDGEKMQRKLDSLIIFSNP